MVGDTPSGEYSALLLAGLKELREDQKEFRTRVEGKLDLQALETQKILIQLTAGDGRMNLMQQTINELQAITEANQKKMHSIESISGLRPAIRGEARPEGGWISADRLPALLAALGTLIAVILSSIALMRSPAASAEVVKNITAPAKAEP